MLQMLGLYYWTIAAGVVIAAVLAYLGCHLAARDKAMQTLCVGQGASLGVLVGLGVIHSLTESEAAIHFGPFVTAIGVSASTFVLSDWVVARKAASKNTYFTSIFAVLLASGYFVSAMFPALESHMTQVFFGDLATLTRYDLVFLFALGLVFLPLQFLSWRAVSNQSFEIAVFGESALGRQGASTQSRRERALSLAFNLLSLVMLSFSVQFVGFLFTVTCLFLPTSVLNYMAHKGLRLHFGLSMGLAAIGTALGFVLSLYLEKFPTVPTIVLTVLLFGFAVVAIDRSLFRARVTSG